MNRFCNFVLCFFFTLLSEAALAASLTMRAPSLEATAGSSVDVPIDVAGASGIGALHLEVTYDPAVIKPDTVTRGALAGGNSLIDFNPDNPGRLIIGIATLDDIKGDGVLATARFKVVGEAGQSSPLGIERGEAWEGASRQSVLVKTEAGKLTVKGGLPGWWLWILIGLLALILLLLLWFVVGRRRRKTAPVAAPAAATSVQTGRGRFCSYCGTPNTVDSSFCQECGKPLAQLAV
jgi:hypothetical protein